MTTAASNSNSIGTALAARLGLTITKREGHDLAGPCVACTSSDAFRIHQETGVAYCYSCGAKWSPFRLAEDVLGSAEQAKSLMVELGIFQPPSRENGKPHANTADPLATVARQKGVPADSLKAYGTKGSSDAIVLPAYGPDGAQCTTMTISVRGGKGMFARGKPAGLFFPHDENGVRLPKPGETWHLVEGPKDAAALHGAGLVAAGLNTCRLAAKFARLFAGVEVVLIPDRDRAGEYGAQHSARVLRGVARSVRVVVLPAEFKESDGDDVRDVLRRPDGDSLLKQAIEDAQLIDGGRTSESDGGPRADTATEIELPEGEPLTLTVSPTFGKSQRLVVARRGEVSHRDRINTDSSISRSRFVKKLAGKLGIEMEALELLVDPVINVLADQVDEHGGGASAGEDDQPSQATLAANMATDWDLWHTPDKVAYATIPVGNHDENWQVRSQTFKRYVAKRFFEEHEKAMGSDALSAAANLIEAKALFDGEEHAAHVRLAEHAGNIYVDLCNDEWQVVEITPNGWQVIDEAPVRFRRSRAMLPLPVPKAGGRVADLRDFLNVDDANWPLAVAWLIAALRPRGPYPVLALFGEQGSAKSTTGRLLRDLIDPNSAPLRAEPRDGRDLAIAANNSWNLAYDNLSNVPSWLSDALCRLSTGGGFATRELYSDQDEVIFDSQRPVLLTSIEEVATRSDLLDRCLIVSLPAISEDRRRPEAELLEAFHSARPSILGALLDAVSGALRDLPKTRPSALPRMADFALWVSAAERSLGWTPGSFVLAYQGNQASANEVALESSIVARPLLELLEDHGKWCGTSSELLEALETKGNEQATRQRSWPKNARSLSGHLKRLAPNLRAAGWEVEFHRESSRRLWTIRRSLPAMPAASSLAESGHESFDQPAAQTDADSYHGLFDDAGDGDDAIPDDPKTMDIGVHDEDGDVPF